MSLPDTAHPKSPRDPSFETVLECYFSLIRDIAEALETIRPEIGSASHQQLNRTRIRLAQRVTTKSLEATRDTLHAELKGFAEKARQFQDVQAVRNDRYADRLGQFADYLEKSARSGDFNHLKEQASELREFVKTIQEDNRDALARLQQAERLAYIDALTGVPNRREFDRQLAARLDTGREFCVLLFDLDRFKIVNDKYGHLYGDEILKQLGARLSRQIRARDFICRWGGDEFVVILECGFEPALARAEKIAKWLSGPYRLALRDEELKVDVSVTVGVAERRAGETPEQLFQRVDEALYQQKTGKV
jgi:diguanylate cyclase